MNDRRLDAPDHWPLRRRQRALLAALAVSLGAGPLALGDLLERVGRQTGREVARTERIRFLLTLGGLVKRGLVEQVAGAGYRLAGLPEPDCIVEDEGRM